MLSARNDAGQPVDWWFMYKVSARSESSAGRKATGGEYAYIDADMAASGAGLVLSPHQVTDHVGALAGTLSPLLGPEAQPYGPVGWFFYNDENPITKAVVSSRGHTKGVLAWDAATDTAFWLVISTPLFPTPNAPYSYPATGLMMAQTLLCVTLQNVDMARRIANQMYQAQQPNVYAASTLPPGAVPSPDDARALLMQDKVASGTAPVTATVPFQSRGGQKFIAIAKNRYWGRDFYNDLVGPALHENLEVETWEHGVTPGTTESDGVHQLIPMHSVTLEPLGIPFSWSEAYDHAKLAVSAPTEQVHWVCVGDINYTKAQEKRGGGTVAFQCEPLWQGLAKALSTMPEPKLPRRSGTAAG